MCYVHHWFNSAKDGSVKEKTAKLPYYQLVPGNLTAIVANFRRCAWRYLRRIRYYKRQYSSKEVLSRISLRTVA